MVNSTERHILPFAFALLFTRSPELLSVSDMGDAERPASEESLRNNISSYIGERLL